MYTEKIKDWAKKVNKWGPGFKWYKDGSATWILYKCNEPDMFKRLTKALNVFSNFKSELFGYSLYTYRAVEGREYFRINKIEDLKQYHNKEPRANIIYGIIKVKNNSGEEIWLDGIEFNSSRLSSDSIMIRLYRDDWYIGDISIESLQDFNKRLAELKKILQPKEVDCGKLQNFLFNDLYDEKSGFVIDEILKVRKNEK